MILTPSAAFGLVLGGFLLEYVEALRPGLVVPGVLGLMAILAGCHALFLVHPSTLAIACLCLAVLLFLAETCLRVPWIAGVLASVFLVLGAAMIISGPNRLSTFFAAGVGFPFSALTLWLIRAARQARQNKRHSLEQP